MDELGEAGRPAAPINRPVDPVAAPLPSDAAPPPPRSTREFVESADPAPTDAPSYRFDKPKPSPEPREKAQYGLAWFIIVVVLVMYLFVIVAEVFHWMGTSDFKEVCVALGAPLGLASAVTGFLYGSTKRDD